MSEAERKCRILSQNKIPEAKWQRLISENLLRSSLFSAKVEGNTLNLKDITRLSTKKREHLEIRNLMRAIKYISKNIRTGQKITPKFICRLHKIALDKIERDAGFLRKKQNAIFNKEGFVVYMPPPPEEAKKNLQKLIKYINSKKHTEYPLAKAIIAHFVFEKIHPFIDGNGRVGRLLIYAVLKIIGTEELRAISFEEKLNEERENYYYFLESEKNASSFVEFMLDVINQSFSFAIAKIQKNAEGENVLLPRRGEILEIIRDHKFVSADFLKRRFQEIPARTLRSDLEDLMGRNLIIKLGKTRGAVYKIK